MTGARSRADVINRKLKAARAAFKLHGNSAQSPERNFTHHCDRGAFSNRFWKSGDDQGRG